MAQSKFPRTFNFPKPIRLTEETTKANSEKFNTYFSKPKLSMNMFVIINQGVERRDETNSSPRNIQKTDGENSSKESEKLPVPFKINLNEFSRDFRSNIIDIQGDYISLSNTITKLFLKEKFCDHNLTEDYYKFNYIRMFFNKKYKNLNVIKATYDNYNKKTRFHAALKMNSCLKSDSTKRVEENNKFIFKYVLKDMMVRFRKERRLPNLVRTEKLFYEHYFKAISDRIKYPLSCFYDPLYNKHMVNPLFKSINNKYLKFVFQDDGPFLQEFQESLENLVDQYRSTVFEQVKELVWPVFEKLSKHPCKKKEEEIFNKEEESLSRKKALKLPWTDAEIKQAVTQFKSVLRDRAK